MENIVEQGRSAEVINTEKVVVFVDEDVRGTTVEVNDAHLLDVGHMAIISNGQIKKKEGRPRKKVAGDTLVSGNETVSLSNSSLLDLGSDKIAERVWQIGLELGVSGGGEEFLLKNKLGELERRDRLAIGREDKL
ncbi:hypothetical protein SESBI_48824 [Sesbania bispinosa]|nr:hypothetical protein SESBI_48824 [Sesbania bispinosa]